MVTDFEKRKNIKKAVKSTLTENGESRRSAIRNFEKKKVMDYPEQQELFERVLSLVHEYDNDMSVAAAIGVLDLAKNELLNPWVAAV